MFDEASDINMYSKLNVFVNALLPSGEVRTFNIALCEIQCGDSATIFETLIRALEEAGVTLTRIIGICSDGASTMIGERRGVCTQVSSRIKFQSSVLSN